ncbi:MAG: hypothetical protein OEV60_13230 [Actinomycetota bacterium]|nr:hypothetical protein [Actinomycetota bacterium]
MKKMLTSILACTMLFVVLGAAPASAHERIENSTITINASSRQVPKGKKVSFQGKLKSPWSRCFNWRPVTLYKGKTPVATKKTRQSGYYKFTVRVTSTKTWKVKFGGRKWGKHPHVHRCIGSSSKGIKVRAL